MPTRHALLVLASTLCLAAAGCNHAPDEPPTAQPTLSAVDGTYQITARGQVVSTSEDAITIRNEAIAAHPLPSGETGLDPTDRAYPLSDTADPAGINEGDTVEFTFSIPTDAPDSPTLISITKLDGGTELDFTCLTRQYDTRGIVRQLPVGVNLLQIEHEFIPSYRGRDGELGMPVMLMPFPLAADLSLDGISVGDKVALTFEVDYAENHIPKQYYVIEIEKLDPSIELDLGGG